MNAITPRRYRFGRYDRITIEKAHYRAVGKVEDRHTLQLVSGNVLQQHWEVFSDDAISQAMRRNNFRLEEDYFSRASTELRIRHDDTDLLTLTEEQLRDVNWKAEWCKRFEAARINPNYAIKLNLGTEALQTFIGFERERMDGWYRRKYGERRKLGRKVVPEGTIAGHGKVEKEPKEFDYPSPSGLRRWLKLYRDSGYRLVAFRPRYRNCGRREQLHPEVERLVAKCVEGYKNAMRPTGREIVDAVAAGLERLNAKRPGQPELSVSSATIYKRIAKLDPFEVELARYGANQATRRYAMIQDGSGATVPLERVEMDDWEFDLFVLATKSSEWKTLTKKQRKMVPRVRCTVTVAIDCATRCIVGLNVSPQAPSTPATRATIHSILNDKTRLAEFGYARSDWKMFGRPEVLATDGGPVFDNEEVNYTLGQAFIGKILPEDDPRKRGTIEAFFKTFKRLCRRFAGQSFASVVERGDYPAEEMASLTFEKFYRSVVRFVVDYYHHTGHRGLEGSTPYATWDRLTAKHDMAVPPSTAQQIVAFGFRHKSWPTLDKHGLLYLGLSYTSSGAEALMRRVGYGTRMPIFINPHDIGTILVHVEEDHRDAIGAADPARIFGEFLEVPAAVALPRPYSLADHLLASEAVRRMVKKDCEAGKELRIAASEDLFEEGRKAMMEAGVQLHQLTQGNLDRATAEIERLSHAGRGTINFASEQAQVQEGSVGEILGHVKRTRPRAAAAKAVKKLNRAPLSGPRSTPELGPVTESVRRPFSRSANMDGED